MDIYYGQVSDEIPYYLKKLIRGAKEKYVYNLKKRYRFFFTDKYPLQKMLKIVKMVLGRGLASKF